MCVCVFARWISNIKLFILFIMACWWRSCGFQTDLYNMFYSESKLVIAVFNAGPDATIDITQTLPNQWDDPQWTPLSWLQVLHWVLNERGPQIVEADKWLTFTVFIQYSQNSHDTGTVHVQCSQQMNWHIDTYVQHCATRTRIFYKIRSPLLSARLALPLNPTHDEFHCAASSCGSQAMPHDIFPS